MGREIRRVPIDFDWPIGKTWKGFLNPYYRECPKALLGECHNGYTNDGKWLNAIARFIALIGEEAVNTPYADTLRASGRIFPHPYLQEFSLAPRTDIPREEHLRIRSLPKEVRLHALKNALQMYPPQILPPGKEMVEFVTALASKSPDHGDSLEWYVEKALKRAAGIEPENRWGICKICEGHGVDPAVRELWEGWQREGPPVGDGWQLWETVSEGSPISPVFATAEGLIDWMSQPDKDRGGYPRIPWAQGYKREHAEAFVRGPGWAPSVVQIDAQVMGGVEAVACKDAL